LAIDADRILTATIAFQGLQPIAGQSGKIGQRRCRAQNLKTLPSLPCESPKGPHRLTVSELSRQSVPIAQDHS
jgi:hypothetical protein